MLGGTYLPIVYTVKEVGENGTIKLNNGTEQYDVSYACKISRYYTRIVNGVPQPTVTVSDENWTAVNPGDTLLVETEKWARYGKREYALLSANVNGTPQDTASFEVNFEKLQDGANSYEVHVYYNYSKASSRPDPNPDPGPNPNPGGTEEIPDADTPMTDLPKLEEIPDEEPPLAELLEQEIIEEPEVPLGDAPKTGDENRMGLWAVLMGLSAVSIAALLGSGKKRKEEEQA